MKASELKKLIYEEVRRALDEGMTEKQVQDAFKVLRGDRGDNPTPMVIKTLQSWNPTEYQQMQDALAKILSTCKPELLLANQIMDKWTYKYVFKKMRPKK